MSEKLATRVKKTAEFKKLVGKKPLSYREEALFQLVLRVGQERVGGLREELAKREGDLMLSREQTKVAVFIGTGGKVLSGGLNFLFTPFSQMPELYFNREVPALEGGDPERSTENELEVSPVEVSPTAKVEAQASPNVDAFISGLPGWAQSILNFARDRIATLSPATTAILFVLSVTAAIYYGEHSKAGIEESYRLLKEASGRDASQAEKVPELEDELEALKGDIEVARLAESGLNQQVASLQDSLEEAKDRLASAEETHSDTLATQADEHQAELDKLRTGLEETTKTKIKEVESDNRDIRKRLAEVEKARDDHFAALQVRTGELRIAENQLKETKRSLESKRADYNSIKQHNRELASIETDYTDLTAFTRDLLGLVSMHLLKAPTRYITANRNDFKEKYRLIYDRIELFKGLGYSRF